MPTLERLMTLGEQHALQGDLDAAAHSFSHAAHSALQARRFPEALLAFVSVSRLRMMQGRLDEAEQALGKAEGLSKNVGPLEALHGLRARAEFTDLKGPPEARIAAWKAVLTRGGPEERMLAHGHLADLCVATSDIDGATDHLRHAELEAQRLGDANRQAALGVEQAAILTSAGRLDEATSALIRAEPLLDRAEPGVRTRHKGQAALIAAGRGDLAGALQLAMQSRSLAVSGSDVPSYLAATWTIVMLHEQAGRLLEVYDTLLRAKHSLKSLLGEDGEALVTPAVAAFEARIGPDALAELQARWVEARRAGRLGDAT